MEGLHVPVLPSTRDEQFRRVVQDLKEPVTRRGRLDVEGLMLKERKRDMTLNHQLDRSRFEMFLAALKRNHAASWEVLEIIGIRAHSGFGPTGHAARLTACT